MVRLDAFWTALLHSGQGHCVLVRLNAFGQGLYPSPNRSSPVLIAVTRAQCEQPVPKRHPRGPADGDRLTSVMIMNRVDLVLCTCAGDRCRVHPWRLVTPVMCPCAGGTAGRGRGVDVDVTLRPARVRSECRRRRHRRCWAAPDETRNTPWRSLGLRPQAAPPRRPPPQPHVSPLAAIRSDRSG